MMQGCYENLYFPSYIKKRRTVWIDSVPVVWRRDHYRAIFPSRESMGVWVPGYWVDFMHLESEWRAVSEYGDVLCVSAPDLLRCCRIALATYAQEWIDSQNRIGGLLTT